MACRFSRGEWWTHRRGRAGWDDRVTSGDVAALSGFTPAGARGVLDRLVDDGRLVRGEVAGRNAHYMRQT